MARPGLTSHRKFRRLKTALGCAMQARGALELIWETCYESGDDYLGTAHDIETLVGWQGECGKLTAALRDAGAPEGIGFIEIVKQADQDLSTTYRVHDLWHHAPDYVTKRHKRELERRQKVAPTTKRRRSAPNGGQRTPSPDKQLGVDRTPSPAPSPAHAPSPQTSVSAAPSNGAPPDVAETLLLEFPTVGQPQHWWLTDRQVGEWIALYPNLDVLAECRKALAWIRAKPANRKTAGGMPQFLVGWFGRAVNGRARSPDWTAGDGNTREGRIVGAGQRMVEAIRRGEV